MTNARKQMRDFWDRKARENAMYYISSFREYDDQNADEFWKWGTILAERFLGESGLVFSGREAVLEIGCGIGRMTRYFAGRFDRVVGLDVSDEMIRGAKENLRDAGNAELIVGNGEDFRNFDDGVFDLVFSYIVLQHIPDPRVAARYIREAGRVLRAGGHFYFQVNTTPYSWRERLGRTVVGRMIRALRGGQGPSEAAPPSGPRELDHPAWQGSRLSVHDVGDACEAGGLRVERVTGEGTQYTWVLATRT